MFEQLDDKPGPSVEFEETRWQPHVADIRRRVRTRRRTRAIGRGTFASVAVIALVGLGLAWRWNRTFDRIRTVDVATSTAETSFDGPLNVLVVGFDTDKSVDGRSPGADFVRLVRVSPGEPALVAAIPRDLDVGSMMRLSRAASAADPGTELNAVADAVEQLGLPVDHALGIDLEGSELILDWLGPRFMEVSAPPAVEHIADPATGLDLRRSAGDFECAERSGRVMLAFARSRRLQVDGVFDTRGDLGRMARDSDIVDSLIGQTLAEVTNPSEVDRALNLAAAHMQRDSHFTVSRAWDILSGIDRATPQTRVVATADFTSAEGAAMLRVVNSASNRQMWSDFGSTSGILAPTGESQDKNTPTTQTAGPASNPAESVRFTACSK